jgi:hypothetical protein
MRTASLLASLAASGAVVLTALSALGSGPKQVAGDESIGTTPARPSVQPQAPAASEPNPFPTWSATPGEGPAKAPDVKIAEDPPMDWAVLYGGLRPRLGTFGGITTLAVAHARTERFYGAFSFSAVRNDAGTHVGVAQLALGRNLSDTYIGGVQLSLTENRAKSFYGISEIALAYNRTVDMVGVAQFAGYNRAKTFTGVAQLAGYNRADKRFSGVTQLGLYNHARGSFAGLVQLGPVNAAGEDIFGSENGPADHGFLGLGQVGILNTVDGDFTGIGQFGLIAYTSRKFSGVVQTGVFASSRRFDGLAQVGAVTMAGKSHGAQISAFNIAYQEHTGLQVAGLINGGRSVRGLQVGLGNVTEEVTGLQIGLINHTRKLRGVQIGLANHATDGVLPWTALLNMGFGDGDGGGLRDDDDKAAQVGRRY